MKYLRYIISILLPGICLSTTTAQIVLDLPSVLRIANDSSLEAMQFKSSYLSDYWEYRNYKAKRLPSLTLTMTPLQYNRDIVERYISESNQDEYRAQQSLYSNGTFTISQNIDFTGGNLYANSNLSFLKNTGESTYNQYTSVPIKIGYSQSLIGYNAFKWDKRIEPLKIQKSQREFLYNKEGICVTATTYFFNLALAQEEEKLAQRNKLVCDTLLSRGTELSKLNALSKADLLTLQLQLIESQNAYISAKNNTNKAMFALASFLRLPNDTKISLCLPKNMCLKLIDKDLAIQNCRNNNPTYLEERQKVLEAQQTLDKAHKERYFEANMDMSVGFNQYADQFSGVFKNLMRQDMISFGLTIPLVDWGIRKGSYNLAKSSLAETQTEANQKVLSVEEDVYSTVNDFNVQQNIVNTAYKAIQLSKMVYSEALERFTLGRDDIKKLIDTFSNCQEAEEKYIEALQNYWLNYYKLCQLTLYDYQKDTPLDDLPSFDHKYKFQ